MMLQWRRPARCAHAHMRRRGKLIPGPGPENDWVGAAAKAALAREPTAVMQRVLESVRVSVAVAAAVDFYIATEYSALIMISPAAGPQSKNANEQ